MGLKPEAVRDDNVWVGRERAMSILGGRKLTGFVTKAPGELFHIRRRPVADKSAPAHFKEFNLADLKRAQELLRERLPVPEWMAIKGHHRRYPPGGHTSNTIRVGRVILLTEEQAKQEFLGTREHWLVRKCRGFWYQPIVVRLLDRRSCMGVDSARRRLGCALGTLHRFAAIGLIPILSDVASKMEYVPKCVINVLRKRRKEVRLISRLTRDSGDAECDGILFSLCENIDQELREFGWHIKRNACQVEHPAEGTTVSKPVEVTEKLRRLKLTERPVEVLSAQTVEGEVKRVNPNAEKDSRPATRTSLDSGNIAVRRENDQYVVYVLGLETKRYVLGDDAALEAFTLGNILGKANS